MIQALIFDFDGLILDTELPDYMAWQEVYRAYGVDLPEKVWATNIGIGTAELPFDPYAYLEKLVGRPIDRRAIAESRHARHAVLIEEQSVLPGVVEYLVEARQLGLALGVASSSSRTWVQGHLARLGLLDCFSVIRCSDDVSQTKPAPDLYLAALQGLDVAAHDAIALEDSPNGLRAAKTAGLFCVAVPCRLTASLPLDRADLRLVSLADLPLAALLDLAHPPAAGEASRG